MFKFAKIRAIYRIQEQSCSIAALQGKNMILLQRRAQGPHRPKLRRWPAGPQIRDGRDSCNAESPVVRIEDRLAASFFSETLAERKLKKANESIRNHCNRC